MTKYKFGDIVLVLFSHLGGNKKKRPALVILDIGDDDIVLAPITTTKRTKKGDYEIKDWNETGLLLKSWVRLAKINYIAKKDIDRTLGHITNSDKKKIISVWDKLYRFH